VPLVKADARPDWDFPFYLDPDYKKYYFRLINEFGNHIRMLPDSLHKIISFVQVQTGSTGDEAPYKGNAINPQYEIDKSSTEWRDFRLEAFAQFDTAFQEISERDIPLLFNGIGGEYEKEWQWVLNNITEGFGIKGSAYVRGHHLTGERAFTETWKPYLVNPKGLHLFSRSEMDQTWKKSFYQLNLKMNFYWGALNGLNSGLGIWDVTSSALEVCKEEGFDESFEFFNKYAGEIYPQDAKDAFCVFHEGLDASDIDKFPETIYGIAEKSNKDRYVSICNAYAQRGARMDDLDAAVKGQVYQRANQIGFNDAGWEIWPSNYERFLYQIDAEETSVGWWRIGGDITNSTPIYSRFARAFDSNSGKDTMYFDIEDKFFSGKIDPITIHIVYYDIGGGWELHYDALDQSQKVALALENGNSKSWKEVTVSLSDGYFRNRCPRRADLLLVNNDDKDNIFHMIEISKEVASNVEDKVIKNNNSKLFHLKQNYPNPFNPNTTIRFLLSVRSEVKLNIFNIRGQKIKSLLNGEKPAGNYSVTWNGTNNKNMKIASGVYFIRMQCNVNEKQRFVEEKKLVLLR
jgi:hypothetical protein